MFWLIHSLLAILIASKLDSLPLIIILSFFSHFILDSIPHWDSFFDKRDFEKRYIARIGKKDIIIRSLDFILMIFITFYFYSSFNNIMIPIAVLFSLLPDIIKVLYFTPIKKTRPYKAYLNFHSRIQHDIGIFWGLLNQTIVAILIIFLIYV